MLKTDKNFDELHGHKRDRKHHTVARLVVVLDGQRLRLKFLCRAYPTSGPRIDTNTIESHNELHLFDDTNRTVIF